MNKTSTFLYKGYNNPISKMVAKVLPVEFVLFFIEQEKSITPIINKNEKTISIPSIEHSNECIDSIIKICEEYEFNDNISLCVFGSIASNEIIAYSDFDACLIYDEQYFDSRKKIGQLRKLIEKINLAAHLQDSLQHHGITIAGKNEIIHGPHLTSCLIKESKLIYGNDQLIIVEDENQTEYTVALNKLTNSILKKLADETKWKNQYYFKNLISELLLYPCSYLQKKNQKYISKKDSFELIKSEFTNSEIMLIHKIENIRINWKQRKIKSNDISDSNIKDFKKNEKTDKLLIEELKKIKSDLVQLLNKNTG